MRKKIADPLTFGGASLLFAFFPLGFTLLGSLIATLCDCKVDEGSAHPCMMIGLNLGDTLYEMGNFFWLCLITVPIGGVGVIISVIWLMNEIFSTNRPKN